MSGIKEYFVAGNFSLCSCMQKKLRVCRFMGNFCFQRSSLDKEVANQYVFFVEAQNITFFYIYKMIRLCLHLQTNNKQLSLRYHGCSTDLLILRSSNCRPWPQQIRRKWCQLIWDLIVWRDTVKYNLLLFIIISLRGLIKLFKKIIMLQWKIWTAKTLDDDGGGGACEVLNIAQRRSHFTSFSVYCFFMKCYQACKVHVNKFKSMSSLFMLRGG